MAITDWDISINGTDVPRMGRKTQIKEVENIRSARTANGNLKQDILYVKREFVFSYDKVPESILVQLQSWRSLYLSTQTSLTLSYLKPGGVAPVVVSVVPKAIDYSLMTIAADNLYSGVRFTLVET